jgi:hypothetical protein
MPFKSQAQRRKFAELLVKGEISPETFEEWNRETGSVKLPERVKGSAKRSSKKRAAPRKRTASKQAASKQKASSRSKSRKK